MLTIEHIFQIVARAVGDWDVSCKEMSTKGGMTGMVSFARLDKPVL